MNTFWQRFRPSTSDPNRLRTRLVRVFEESRLGDRYTIDDLTNLVKADSKKSVAFTLGDLTSARKIDQIVQVVSPKNGGGIRYYAEISQVPNSLYDPYQDLDIDVEPRLIKIFFTKHNPNEHITDSGLIASGEHRAMV